MRVTPGASQERDRLFRLGEVTTMTSIAEATLRVWERRYAFPPATRTQWPPPVQPARRVGASLGQNTDWMRACALAARFAPGTSCGREAAVATALHEPLPRLVPADRRLVVLRHGSSERLVGLRRRARHNAHGRGRHSALTAECGARYRSAQHSRLSANRGTWARRTWRRSTSRPIFLRQQLLWWMQSSPPPFDVAPVVLACAPEELHEGSLLMLAILLRLSRWPVAISANRFPSSDLASARHAVGPP